MSFIQQSSSGNVFGEYGANAARLLISRARQQPKAQRAAFLRSAVDKIDPTIWPRAEVFATASTRAGVHPAVAAEAGISRAMSEGIVKELIEVGKRGTVTKRGQVGLAGTARTHGAYAGVPRPGTAPAPPRKVLKIGPWQVPIDTKAAMLGVSVVDNRTTKGSYKLAIPVSFAKQIGNEIVRQFQILYDKGVIKTLGFLDGGDYCVSGPALVPASDLGFVVPPLMSPVPGGMTAAEIAQSPRLKELRNMDVCPNVAGMTATIWPAALYSGGWIPAAFLGYKQARTLPLFRVKHPVTNEDYGLFLQASQIDGGNPSLAVDQNSMGRAPGGVLRVDVTNDRKFSYLHAGGPGFLLFRKIYPVERSAWDSFWMGVAELAAEIGEFLEDVGKDIAGLACKLLTSGVGQAGAAAAGAAAGGPAGAAAAHAGAQMAAGACGGGGGPPVILPPPSSNLLPLLLIGGGVILIAVVASKKK